ncbi:MAG TPA: alpha/beta fold hydrolase [Acidiferrobacterales bacterium]|nr:alpha/beta fold hydrolase [Acidiferrobacterales bacterium]
MSKPANQEVITVDGHRIIGRFFLPQGEAKGTVLIAPAMGTPQEYYAPFATWLATQGFVAATFDYRGTGLSRLQELRGFKADIFDWAQLDCGAMVEATSMRAPGKPFYWIGHSLGGQILPFVPNRDRIAKVVTIATGSGYWRENSPPLKRRVWWLWYVVAPLAVPLFGYFPGKRLRKVGDLPRGVMEQWRRWCLNPEYAVGVEGEGVRAQYAAVRTPIVSLSFSDDELMSARNTESIHGFFVNAPRTMKRITPKDIGVRRIGHFGFFRPEHESSLWQAHLLPELTEHMAS